MHVISYVRAKKEKVSTYASFMDSSSVTHVENKIIFSNKKRTPEAKSEKSLISFFNHLAKTSTLVNKLTLLFDVPTITPQHSVPDDRTQSAKILYLRFRASANKKVRRLLVPK